ncbi:DUF6421 family protein [Staphylococcus gallinarum]|uniref:DUF6421 family protein n=1 Tax=Staphylococcus gallinarum TaxID=1293 RepID=UPI002DBD03C9|nr:DUF6421 family protein [Staphylococcus gallinarum]MEB6242703.1 DUF6421 family protein [Staphylococcus gallinarum]MEB6295883.1 DUF6421 family protein [Staphylococcus gallinarum]
MKKCDESLNNICIRNYFEEEIIPYTNIIKSHQSTDGSIIEDKAYIERILYLLNEKVNYLYKSTNNEILAKSFEQDIQSWIDVGLGYKPDFINSLKTLDAPNNNELVMFVGPVKCPNGPKPTGFFFEAILAQRDEPQLLKEIEKILPHPGSGCQSCKLITGSNGVIEGNCIVFFPENISTKEKINNQSFAVFFFNKFQKIWMSETIKRANILIDKSNWISTTLSSEDCYTVRSIWGYLHDYFHHKGPRPLSENLQSKMNFHSGILEEIKVDCESILTLDKYSLPYKNELLEFVILERLIRYPGQPDALTNFDAGTGYFLFEWLLENGNGLKINKSENLEIDFKIILDDITKLVEEIVAIEKINDDDKYKKLAKSLVMKYLPSGVEGTRFSTPKRYKNLSHKVKTNTENLDFKIMNY